MKLVINNYEIELPDNEVKSCRKVAGKMLKTVKEKSDKGGYLTYYLTFLLVMRMLTEELILAYKPENIKRIMKILGGKMRPEDEN